MLAQLIRLVALLCIVTLLGGCGQKGDLYLPDSSTAIPVSSPIYS